MQGSGCIKPQLSHGLSTPQRPCHPTHKRRGDRAAPKALRNWHETRGLRRGTKNQWTRAKGEASARNGVAHLRAVPQQNARLPAPRIGFCWTGRPQVQLLPQEEAPAPCCRSLEQQREEELP